MSYFNPIDKRIVEVVLDDLQDNNQHTLAELLAKAYGLPWGNIPEGVTEEAYEAAVGVLNEYRLAKYREAVSQ